jgi:hypothetical protein
MLPLHVYVLQRKGEKREEEEDVEEQKEENEKPAHMPLQPVGCSDFDFFSHFEV